MSSMINKSEKFWDKYRVESTRLKGYDYSSENAYFVTICTKDKNNYFGEILKGKLQTTKLAKICLDEWHKIPKYYSNCALDAFVIMPNHVHGIIIINNDNLYRRDAIHRVSQLRVSPIYRVSRSKEFGGITKNNNPMLYTNLSTIIRYFKGRVSYEAKKHGICFCWQSRFFDHIIRNEYELNKIREYILNNPLNWENDRNNNDPCW